MFVTFVTSLTVVLYLYYKDLVDVDDFFVMLPIWNVWIHGVFWFYHDVTHTLLEVERICRCKFLWTYFLLNDFLFVFLYNWWSNTLILNILRILVDLYYLINHLWVIPNDLVNHHILFYLLVTNDSWVSLVMYVIYWILVEVLVWIVIIPDFLMDSEPSLRHEFIVNYEVVMLYFYY